MAGKTRATKLTQNGHHAGKIPLATAVRPPPFTDLLGIAVGALQMWPPLYIRSIFGLPNTWLPPYRRYSEFSLLNLWRPLRALKYVRNTLVPSIPRTPPPFSPPVYTDLFWQPTVILQRPDHNGSYTTFPDEHWIMINGIMTNDAVAQLNAAVLAELFHRPITLVQNSTNSLFVDLYQCALDKQGWHITEAATKAFALVYDSLKSPYKGKVVLIAHSQGTIVAAAVLELLHAITRAVAQVAEGPVPVADFAPPEFIYPAEFPIDLTEFEPLTPEELAKLEALLLRHVRQRDAVFK